jgi:hypothetical protein
MNCPRLPPSGPSGQGWSDIGSFMVCPQMWAYRNLLGLGRGGGSPAMALGSAVHLALAAHYLRVMWRQHGMDPDEAWLAPRAAVREMEAREDAEFHLDVDQRTDLDGILQAVLPAKERETYTIEAVEAVTGIVLGELDAPGHPSHGRHVIYAPRVDLVWKDTKGKYWIVDHKTAASPAKSRQAYSLHGQFLAMRLIGRTTYGDAFGGVRLHLIKTTDPYGDEWLDLEPAPAADKRMADRMLDAYCARARLEVETAQGLRTAWDWPAACNELVCYHRYGKCFGWDYCRWGSRAG